MTTSLSLPSGGAGRPPGPGRQPWSGWKLQAIHVGPRCGPSRLPVTAEVPRHHEHQPVRARDRARLGPWPVPNRSPIIRHGQAPSPGRGWGVDRRLTSGPTRQCRASYAGREASRGYAGDASPAFPAQQGHDSAHGPHTPARRGPVQGDGPARWALWFHDVVAIQASVGRRMAVIE